VLRGKREQAIKSGSMHINESVMHSLNRDKNHSQSHLEYLNFIILLGTRFPAAKDAASSFRQNIDLYGIYKYARYIFLS